MTQIKKCIWMIIRILIGALVAIVFLLSGYKVCNYFYEARQSSSVTDDLIGKAVETVQDNQPESNTAFSLVAEPTEYTPITVDFSILQAENEDIIMFKAAPPCKAANV